MIDSRVYTFALAFASEELEDSYIMNPKNVLAFG